MNANKKAVHARLLLSLVYRTHTHAHTHAQMSEKLTLKRIRRQLLRDNANVLFYYDPADQIVWREHPRWYGAAPRDVVDYDDILVKRQGVTYDYVSLFSIASRKLNRFIQPSTFNLHLVGTKTGLLSQYSDDAGFESEVTVEDNGAQTDGDALALALEGAIARAQRQVDSRRTLCMFWVMCDYSQSWSVTDSVCDRLSLDELLRERGVRDIRPLLVKSASLDTE